MTKPIPRARAAARRLLASGGLLKEKVLPQKRVGSRPGIHERERTGGLLPNRIFVAP